MYQLKSLFFCIDLICGDLLGLQIDVIKCTVPCPKESCCQMGGCEAIVLYKNKRLFLLCSYSAVNISRCLDIDKKML